MQRLREGKFDAIIIASAGVKRLNLDLSDLQAYPLPCESFIPAPAQGILALQCRENDTECIEVLKKINHTDTQRRVWLEREILKRLVGGCQVPIGACATCVGGHYSVHATYSTSHETTPKRILGLSGGPVPPDIPMDWLYPELYVYFRTPRSDVHYAGDCAPGNLCA